jgi:hypothetical protein
MDDLALLFKDAKSLCTFDPYWVEVGTVLDALRQSRRTQEFHAYKYAYARAIQQRFHLQLPFAKQFLEWIVFEAAARKEAEEGQS